MTRRLIPFGLGCTALALLLSSAALAEELPLRKPGLWELKVARNGSGLPQLTMQHCTDATIDRDMNNTVSPIAKQICSRQNVQKTAAPITAYLLGVAVGAGDADPDQVERLAARAQQLAESWDRPADAKDPDDVPKSWEAELAKFRSAREKYLIYD